jgi:hypothetical protein
MTLDNFKVKWATEIEKGIVAIDEKTDTIIADRFDGENFLCDRNHLNKIQSDLRKMGYFSVSIGVYCKKLSFGTMATAIKHYEQISKD